MKFYAVIDTNVLVSSLLSSHPNAATVQVVDRIFDGSIIPLFSSRILAEYHEVLRRKKFSFTEALIDMLLQSIEASGLCIDPAPSEIRLPDLKDLPFYEVVLETRSENSFLVTGNLRHFPAEPFIVTPREFLDIIDSAAKSD